MMLTFLDVAVGLALLFASLSVFCSSLLEAWSGWTGKRGMFLLQAIFELMGDLSLYRRLVHHHAIASSFDGRPGAGKPPSYLSSDRFEQRRAEHRKRREKQRQAERDVEEGEHHDASLLNTVTSGRVPTSERPRWAMLGGR